MVRTHRRQTTLWIAVSSILVLGGYTGVPERQPAPREYTNTAEIPGFPEARFWGDEWPTFSVVRFELLSDDELRREFSGVYDKPHSYLAIPGGGANGAFGAGLLAGWTASGTRPEFTMVTGVSTGALTAPFAYLGPEYDGVLNLKKSVNPAEIVDLA